MIIDIEKVRAHGRAEGAKDFEGRDADVSAGMQDPPWAWPLDGADSEYINAVGITTICRAIGIPVSSWDEIASEWCASFRAGYKEAHDDSSPSS